MSGYWSDFLKIAIAHLLAVASPGPDFAIVLKQSLHGGRKLGVWTAWGVATAICLHVSYCLLGIGLVVRSSPVAFIVLKYVGAGYLAWIGIKALKAKPGIEPETSAPNQAKGRASSRWTAWRTGFFTNALNPKVTLYFLAIFATFVRPWTPLGVQLIYGAWLAGATGLWFTFVARVFSHAAVRRKFLRHSYWIDRAFGVFFLFFAAMLVYI